MDSPENNSHNKGQELEMASAFCFYNSCDLDLTPKTVISCTCFALDPLTYKFNNTV